MILKFRVWDKDEKVMLSNYLGFMITDDGQLLIESMLDDEATMEKTGLDNYIVMQYTELKDPKGVEIFDGDIVHWTKEFTSPSDMRTKRKIDSNEEIHQKESGEWVMGEVGNTLSEELLNVEVIGNIYENPELIS